MITIVFFASLASLVHSGLITHDIGGDDDHNKATSYQNIHMEHFHAVPTYVKKEYKHLLEHPIPAGKSSSKVEIHHGGKHDHGYAIVDTKNDARGTGSGAHEGAGFDLGGHEGGDEGAGLGGLEGTSLGGNDVSNHLAAQALAGAALAHGASGGYQVHDQQQELLQHQAAQIARNQAALQLQAAVAVSHGGGQGGVGQHQAAVTPDHEGYEAALASAALHLQNRLGGHGHS